MYFTKLFRQSIRTQPKKIVFTAGLFVALGLLLGVGTLGFGGTVHAAADCDNNSIIKCGFSSSSDFINTVKRNNSGNGHADLPAIYANFGLVSATDYSRFVSEAVPGTAYKDGRIIVGGDTVVTGAHSMGRIASYHGSNYQTISIGSTNYYANATSQTFASDALPVTVMFDGRGVMQFAVINSCGNPIWGTNTQPAKCTALNSSQVNSDTFQFTTSTAAGNGVSIDHVVYDYGDGTKSPDMSPSSPATHQYKSNGNFTVKVYVYIKLPGGKNIVVASSTCQKVIHVAIPYYSCLQFSGVFIDNDKLKYRFTAAAKFGNGAKFTGADFTFGDGQKQHLTAGSGDSSVSYVYRYGKVGTYNASALLHFTVNGASVTAQYACSATVTPNNPAPPECKPGVPQGSPACSPCQYDSSLPYNSPQCVAPAPPALPNTGAGDVIAIFGVVAVAGFLVYRQLIFRKHRAAFMAAQHGTSPLPLKNPLNELPDLAIGKSEAPSAHRRGLRRRRSY